MGRVKSAFSAWDRLCRQEILDYRAHYAATGDFYGWFSIPRFRSAIRIGAEYIKPICANGLCLDVGCGAYPHPVYMAQGTRFIGVDPDFGFQKRDFPFVQSMGEYLPFASNTFRCVTLMSMLDHVLDPDTVLAEAFRVLVPLGYLFIWYHDQDISTGNHLHYFNDASIRVLLFDHQFTDPEFHFLPRGQGEDYSDTTLAIARKFVTTGDDKTQ